MSAAVAQPNFFQLLLGYPWQPQQPAPQKPDPSLKRRRQPRGPLEAALDKHYTIISRIGKGSTGVVYQAIDRSTQHLVAVKVINRADIRTQIDSLSVRREIHALESLQHSRLLRLRRVHSEGTYLFLVTEYCAQGDLHTHMQRSSKPLPEREALSIARDVLAGLSHMHARGFAHRDVKLENVFLAADGSVRLGDFGMAFYRKPGDDRTAAASTTRRCGSLHYVAPEIFRGNGYVPAHADVWAVGVTLFALLTRTLPFDGPTPRALVDDILAADPLSLTRPALMSRVSRPTRRLLRRMLAVSPDERPTASEAARVCDEIAKSLRADA